MADDTGTPSVLFLLYDGLSSVTSNSCAGLFIDGATVAGKDDNTPAELWFKLLDIFLLCPKYAIKVMWWCLLFVFKQVSVTNL